MREVPVTLASAVSPEIVQEITREVRSLLTLAAVLAWARRASPPRQVEEIVTQDEYTHDVVLPFSGGLHLAFDAT